MYNTEGVEDCFMAVHTHTHLTISHVVKCNNLKENVPKIAPFTNQPETPHSMTYSILLSPSCICPQLDSREAAA